jgi:small subunit ribosomal protein S2
MKQVDLKDLLEAGCHFGHQVTRSNPKAREFIFQEREGIHVIDLAKTREGLLAAGEYVRDLGARNGKILFLGTKRQAKGIIDEAIKTMRQDPKAGVLEDVFYVTERWTGGTFTNFEQMLKNYHKVKDLRSKLASNEEKAKYTKKEVGLWQKELAKLEKLYGGICDMQTVPDAIFIVDTHKEDLAVREATRRNVKTIGMVDTNADPSEIDYPIPANDDAVGSIKFIMDYIVEAWMEGKSTFAKASADKVKADEKEAAKAATKSDLVEGKAKEAKSDLASAKEVKVKKVKAEAKPKTTKKTASK